MASGSSYSVGFCNDCAPMNAAKSEFLRWTSGMNPFLAQFRLSPIADGNLGRTLHVDATIVGRERMHGKPFDRAAGFDATNARAPPIQLEGPGDVGGHGISRIGPGVLRVIGRRGVFLEIEGLDRVGFCAVRQARQEARHRQTEVTRVLRLPQRSPRRVFRCLKIFVRSRGLASSCHDPICITVGLAAAMNGQCAAAAVFDISPRSSTSGGL